MNSSNSASVCIVGAGSVGIMTGYHLSLAGANVTYLVRPHRQEQLSRPQVLYSYDDHSLKAFSDYALLTDPAELEGKAFDYVVVTLDGAALRAEAGQKVVDAIGHAFKDTPTGIILASIGIDLRSEFIERSGLAPEQVTNGAMGTLVYEVRNVSLPVHPGVNAELLKQADYGFRQPSITGFSVDTSAPELARSFAALYGQSGIAECSISSPEGMRGSVAVMAALMAIDLLGWPAVSDISPTDETWQLGIEAMKEIQDLAAFGGAGQASKNTTAEGVQGMFSQLEKNVLPFDMPAFNRYHHGGKVNVQDREIINDAIALGQKEDRQMPATHELVRRLSGKVLNQKAIMKIGIIGTGHIGGSLVRKLSAAGHDVKVANSRGPETIEPDLLSFGARPVEAGEAVADVDAVILSIPMNRLAGLAPLLADLPADTVILDTSNYYPGGTGSVAAIEDGQSEALWVQEQLGRPIVKAWNSVPADTLANNGKPSGSADRIALPVSADREKDRQVGMALVEDTGFDAVNASTIVEAWRHQPGSPAHATDLPRDQLIAALASADRSRLAERRDLLTKVSSEQISKDSAVLQEPGYWVHLSRELYM